MLKTNACPRPFPSEQRQQENTGRLLCGSSLNCLLSIVVLSVLVVVLSPIPRHLPTSRSLLHHGQRSLTPQVEPWQ